mgnify:FL=1
MELREDVLNKLWRVRRTVLQMLDARGYVVLEEDLAASEADFARHLDTVAGDTPRDKMALLLSHRDDPAKSIMVNFVPDEKINVQVLEKYHLRMKDADVKHGILIIPGTITSHGMKILSHFEQSGYRMEIFKEDELMVNITEHDLVPKHTPLSQEEKVQLLSKYKLRETQLPRIMQVDPVAKFFGLVKGQIVKITRHSETAGRYVTYRVVV